MELLPFSLPFSARPQKVWLRALRGSDEQEISGACTASALSLLDRLLCPEPGTRAPAPAAARLSTADRDQVLAMLCGHVFEDRVESALVCERCAAKFSFDFSLRALADSVCAGALSAPDEGVYTTEVGARFRLCTGEDELAIAGLPAEQGEALLLQRCLVGGDAGRQREHVIAAMARVAPTLDLDLSAACSECNHVHKVAFSVQAWFMGLLEREKPRLLRQVHLLAQAYKWSLQEILSLPRTQRLALSALVEQEQRRPRARERWVR